MDIVGPLPWMEPQIFKGKESTVSNAIKYKDKESGEVRCKSQENYWSQNQKVLAILSQSSSKEISNSGRLLIIKGLYRPKNKTKQNPTKLKIHSPNHYGLYLRQQGPLWLGGWEYTPTTLWTKNLADSPHSGQTPGALIPNTPIPWRPSTESQGNVPWRRSFPGELSPP